MREAIAVLRKAGAGVIVDPADLPETTAEAGLPRTIRGIRGKDVNCWIVFESGMKRDFNAWLATLGAGCTGEDPHAVARVESRPSRRRRRRVNGQIQLDNSDAVKISRASLTVSSTSPRPSTVASEPAGRPRASRSGRFQGGRLPHHSGLAATRPRAEGSAYANSWPAHVGSGSGAPGRAQQAQPELAAEAAPAVLAVVQERDAEAVLGEVGPAVAGHLVAGAVPARRPVRRPLGEAERHLVGRGARVHGEREAHLSSVCSSCQSTVVWNSSRREPASSRTICGEPPVAARR